MKVTTQPPVFQPMTIVLETPEEVSLLKALCRMGFVGLVTQDIYVFAVSLKRALYAKTV